MRTNKNRLATWPEYHRMNQFMSFSHRCGELLGAAMLRWACAVVVASFYTGNATLAAEGADAGNEVSRPTAEQLQFFEEKIRPVLVTHCYECHSAEADELQGGLSLDNRAASRRGGDSGPAVVPGDLDESLLIQAIRYDLFEMPPTGKLPKSVVADFEEWIRLGAPDPREGDAAPIREGIDLEAGRQYWAFQHPRKPNVPEVSDAAWPAGDLDRFLLSRIEEAGLEPAAEVDRRTLLRRAYFDLIGLPPSPEAIDAFLADDSPEAFARVVDRLLDSPQFGERWGRHWLDVARFAESSGGGRSLVFNNAWRYRDYVIASFNDDKPYDRFLNEQFAGDLLPYENDQQRAEQLTGTGLLVLGPTNYELQDKELLRMEVVDEQIDTMGRVVLGLTLGCARCHDHKFDPIPASDYYALAGIFRSTKTLTPGNVSGWVEQPLPVGDQREQEIISYETALAALDADIKRSQALVRRLGGAAPAKGEAVAVASLPGIVVDDDEAELTGRWSASSSIRPHVEAGYHYASAGENTAARFVAKLPSSGTYEVRVAHNPHANRATNATVTVHHTGGSETVAVNHRQPPPIEGLFVSLGEFEFDSDEPAEVIVSAARADGIVIADAVQFVSLTRDVAGDARAGAVSNDEDADRQGNDAAGEKALAEAEAKLEQLQKDRKQLEKKAPPPRPVVMSVHDEAETGDYQICIRGDVHNLGEAVPRGFVSVVCDEEAAAQIASGESGRRELAAWLASAENPLTARVMVNRIWHHLFGAGIVRTPDNFGTSGEAPSHPELLDWLAVRFVEQGWSVKSMVREIMLSHAYRLSSQPVAGAARKDPDNRLLARANRRRLDAESLRDAMLAASGQLDLTAGGPTIVPGTKSEFGYDLGTNRRSIYVPVFRNTLDDFLAVFDFADPNLVNGARTTSTLPTQALFMMNSPLVMDQSKKSAESLLAEPGLDDGARLREAYRRTLGRPPRADEIDLTRAYLAESSKSSSDSGPAEAELAAWSRVYQALFSCIDFRYLD